MKIFALIFLLPIYAFGQMHGFSPVELAQIPVSAASAPSCATVQNTAVQTVVDSVDLVATYTWTYFFATNSHDACAIAVNLIYNAQTYNTNQFRVGIAANNPPSAGAGVDANIIGSWSAYRPCSDVGAGGFITNFLSAAAASLTANTSYAVVIQYNWPGLSFPSGSDFLSWRYEAAQNGTSRIRNSDTGTSNIGVNSETAQFITFSQ